MSRLCKVVLVGSCAVVAFDGLASVASLAFHFPYARATVGSCLLYLAIGFLAARARGTQRIRVAAFAGAACGLVDSSLGWWISAIIGPGAPAHPLTVPLWLLTAAIGTLLSAFVACIGGAVGTYRQPPGHDAFASENRGVDTGS